jgi:NADPH2:quinone reductase
MRAVLARGFGGVEVLEVAQVAVPAAGPGQVRIRVEAAAVNPVDLATRSGALTEAGLLPGRDLVGLGWDVAGAIAEAGQGVSGFATGDRVIGLSDRLDVTLGTHADQVVLDATAVARAPAGIPAVAAATLPLSGLTAVQALDQLGLVEGQSLLVTGAAGAVGGFAVQLAAKRGLRVVAVAGQDDEELVRAMGAEWFVPRSAVRLGTAVREFHPAGLDGAVDAAALGVVALDAVRGGGAFAALVPGAAPAPLRGTRVFPTWIRADGARLADLVALAEAGKLTLRVAETFPLEHVRAAHERVAKSGLRGRVVLVP